MQPKMEMGKHLSPQTIPSRLVTQSSDRDAETVLSPPSRRHPHPRATPAGRLFLDPHLPVASHEAHSQRVGSRNDTADAMAPRARTASSLAGLVASDSEPDFDDIQAITAVAKMAAATKRPRGRPPSTANKVSKPVPQAATRRAGGKAVVSASGPPRQALADKSNTSFVRGTGNGAKKGSQNNAKTELGLDEQGGEPVVPKATRGRPKGSGKRKSAGTEVATEKPGQADFEEIAETQPTPESMQVDAEESQLLADDRDLDDGMDESNSVADGGVEDVSLRRRLGNLTRKYEHLETRYRDLKDVGVKAAERNFEHLKRQADENIAGKTSATCLGRCGC